MDFVRVQFTRLIDEMLAKLATDRSLGSCRSAIELRPHTAGIAQQLEFGELAYSLFILRCAEAPIFRLGLPDLGLGGQIAPLCT